MPRIIDEQARRERIAEAVWALVSREGLHGATVRAVAAECGLSTGAIQHSFRSQAALHRFAMELVIERASARIDAVGREGAGVRGGDGNAGASRADGDTAAEATLAAAEDVLLQLLPLDAEREAEARVWAAFSAAALADPALAPLSHQMNRLIEELCTRCLAQLRSGGILGPAADDPLAAPHLRALLDGLTSGLLADPSPTTRRQARDLVHAHLESLRAKRGDAGPST